jgi:hypothetical protein
MDCPNQKLQYTPTLDYNTRRQTNQHELLKLYPDPLKLWLLVCGVYQCMTIHFVF